MELLAKKIRLIFEDLAFNFSIVDIEGKIIFSTTPKKTPFEIKQLIEEKTLDIFDLRENDLLIGHIIFHDRLTEREKALIKRYVFDIHQHVDREREIILKETKETFWRNVLYGNVQPNEFKLFLDKFNISKSSLYAHVLMKITPAVTLHKQELNFICSVFNQYVGEQSLVHAHDMGEGEVVVLFEYSYNISTEESPLRYLRNQVKVYSTDIIAQLQHHPTMHNASIIIAVSEHEYYIEGLSAPFLPLREFIRTAYQLHQHSRVIFFENKPIYMLLNLIPPQAAERYVQMVLGKIDHRHHDAIASLKALFDHDLNVSRAAHALKVHRHTLEYRLQSIKKETELDPMHFQTALQFALAILLKEVYDL